MSGIIISGEPGIAALVIRGFLAPAILRLSALHQLLGVDPACAGRVRRSDPRLHDHRHAASLRPGRRVAVAKLFMTGPGTSQ
jgi:hypothetical protein